MESPVVLGPLTLAQIASGVAALVAIAGLLVATRRFQATTPETEWRPGEPPVERPPA